MQRAAWAFVMGASACGASSLPPSPTASSTGAAPVVAPASAAPSTPPPTADVADAAPPSSATSTTSTTSYHGQVFASCGPTDGPATSVFLTSDDVGCRQAGVGASIRIHVWSRGRGEGTVDIAHGGEALRCASDAPDACERATQGTLEWGRDGKPGRFTLGFADGSKIEGTFVERSC